MTADPISAPPADAAKEKPMRGTVLRIEIYVALDGDLAKEKPMKGTVLAAGDGTAGDTPASDDAG